MPPGGEDEDDFGLEDEEEGQLPPPGPNGEENEDFDDESIEDEDNSGN